MLQTLLRPVIVLLGVVLLVFTSMVGCGGSGEPSPSSLVQPTDVPKTSPVENAVVTIGNLTDLTGVSANAQVYINMALEDMVKYYNDNNLIPGVKVEVVSYDNEFNPARDIPGYEWLKERGADLLVSCVPPTPVSLKPTVDEDEFVMFVATANLEEIMPPGYVFSFGIVPQNCAYTLARWISENHWDYEAKGPAKIGGAAWTDAFSVNFMSAVEEYAEMHPEQFEFQGAYLNNFQFIWDSEIEALKDCDYVFTPTPMHVFVKDYITAGYDTTFIGTDTQGAFMGLIDKGDLWDDIDGMLFIRASQYWTEKGPIIDLTKEILFENHDSAEAETIMRSGVGYLAASQWFQVMEIIKGAAETVGPENIDSVALYNATISYSEMVSGVERYSYDATKRYSPNYCIIQEARAEDQNIYMLDPNWLPFDLEP